MINTLEFPLNFVFKIATFSNDFTVTDVNNQVITYVKQKMFKFIDEISVFDSEAQFDKLYTIKANKWLDFSTTYTFTNNQGLEIGRVARKGWKSIWKAHYEIYDEKEVQDLLIQEKNPWTKVFDSLLGEVPILNFFTGYLFNPSYIVKRPDGTEVAMLTKLPSFFGRRFLVNKLNDLEKGEAERIVLGLMMMVLLERQRG